MLRANGLDAYEDFVTNQVSILANVTPVARGMTYTQIGVVMSLYHGKWFDEHHWRRACRKLGAAPVFRGFPLSERPTSKRAAA